MLRKSFNEDIRFVDVGTLDAATGSTDTNSDTLTVVNAFLAGFIAKIIIAASASVDAILQGSSDGGSTWVSLLTKNFTTGTVYPKLEVVSPGIYSKLRLRIDKTGNSQIISIFGMAVEPGSQPETGFFGCVPQFPTDQVIPVTGVNGTAQPTS